MSTRRDDTVFEVAREMVTELRHHANADPGTSQEFAKMAHTLLIVRAIERLTAAVKANTRAITAEAAAKSERRRRQVDPPKLAEAVALETWDLIRNESGMLYAHADNDDE